MSVNSLNAGLDDLKDQAVRDFLLRNTAANKSDKISSLARQKGIRSLAPSATKTLWAHVVHSAQHSPLGAEGLARARYRLAGYSNEDINRAIKSNDEDFDTLFGPKSGAGHPIAGMLGDILGGVDPSYAIGGGSTAARRALAQGAVQLPASLARQEVNVKTGQQDHVSLRQAMDEAGAAAAFTLGLHGAGKLARLAKDHIAPPKELTDTDLAGDLPPDAIGPEDLHPGETDLVSSEQPSAFAQAETNSQLAPKDGPAPVEPQPTPDGPPEAITDADLNDKPPVAEQAAANEQLAPPTELSDADLSAPADEPVPAPANDADPISRFNEIKTDPDGTKYLHYTTDAGDALPIKMGIEPDGTAEIAVDQFGNGANKLGPAEIRQAMYGLMDQYPEIKRFGGFRRSGAGAGRVQEITPPPRNLLTDEGGSLNIDAIKKFFSKTPEADPELTEPVEQGGFGESPEGEIPEAFYKLADALKRAVPARNDTETLYHNERSARAKALGEIRHGTSGIEGFYQEKAALKGELPTKEWTGLTGMSQEDLENMFDHVKNHPTLGYYQSVTAREGLQKMLQGKVPTRGEITLLAKTLPPNLMRQLLKERSLLSKLMEGAASALNAPKALMSSYDLSAPLRQGVFMVGRKDFYKSLVPMVKSFASPEAYRAVKESIIRDPLYSAMTDSGLAIGEVTNGHNGGPQLLEDAEEPFMSNIPKHIPLIGIGVRASERGFNAFVYKLRADSFRSIYQAGLAAGKQWDEKSLRSLSKMINSFTGRGDLGHKLNNAGPILNSLFFSPRLIKSRADILGLNPAFYLKMDPFVRKEAMKQLAAFVTIAGTVMGLAKFGGAEVDPDPRKADGWKIKVGNTRYDIMGGSQQMVRLMANVATHTTGNIEQLYHKGEMKPKFAERTAIDDIGSFARSKEAPDVGLVHNIMAGNKPTGDAFNPYEAGEELVTPMAFGDMKEAVEDLRKQGVPMDHALAEGIIKASPTIFGVNVSTYDKKPKSKGGRKSSPFGSDPMGGKGAFGKSAFGKSPL